MTFTKFRILVLIAIMSCTSVSKAQDVIVDSVKIHFRQGYSTLDKDKFGNDAALKRIADSLRMRNTDTILQLKKVEVTGAASPEGNIPLNKRLSERRANVLFNYMSQYRELPDSLMTFRFLGRDWTGLLEAVKADDNVPYKEETEELLEKIIKSNKEGNDDENHLFVELQKFKDGKPYKYMYAYIFPALRASQLKLWYEKVYNPIGIVKIHRNISLDPGLPDYTLVMPELEPKLACFCHPKFYMAIKTNMLYDALLVPNIGAEFYVGRGWSIGADWMYAWWKTDRKHDYWRIYGGDIQVRKWFGRAAEEKPLTGHHIGIYAQCYTYDFELGGKGIMGGIPGKDLWDKCNWGVGLEYGYSLPITRRLNIDFGIGVGYFGGEYREYKPIDDHYVWQATKKRNYFGPTKLEVSLVWLIGCGNFNKGKGGRQW